MTFANGHMLNGDWENDKMHGKGNATFNNGDIYEGELLVGRQLGKGHTKIVQIWHNGYIHK